MIKVGDPLNGSGTTTGVSADFLSLLDAVPPSLRRAELDGCIQSTRELTQPPRTAWSLIYLLLNTRKAIVARSPTALAVTGVVAAQAGLYGSYYFGQD